MDTSVNRANGKPQPADLLCALTTAILENTQALERIATLLDEFARAYLTAQFPFGDQRTPDRWSRGR